MSARPFMQLYVSDFIGDTLALSAEQIGAYMLLLMTMWNGDGTLPDDPGTLSRIARIGTENWPVAWATLSPFFDIEDGKVTHGRLSEELAKFARKSAARKEAGSRGGKAKALKDNKTTLAIATRLPCHLPETRIKKARATLSDPTDRSVRLDRYADEALFKACERLTQPAPGYLQFQTWPLDVVAKAQWELAH